MTAPDAAMQRSDLTDLTGAPTMNAARVLLIDRDPYSALLLREDLARHGFGEVAHESGGADLPRSLKASEPELVIFNHHFDHPDDLLACCTVRLLAPKAAIVAIVAVGPAMKTVRAWAASHAYLDAIVKKPLSQRQFVATLNETLKTRHAAAALALRAERMGNLVPEGAVAQLDSSQEDSVELFETVVLFTDIRRSSELITRTPPREFFELLNGCLSAQAAVIRHHDGAVVKYTGDGVMAVFRGMGRSHMALRCACELARSGSQEVLPFGLGVADGLVLAGFLGDSSANGQRRQYDVIGATVHLAARLCNMAAGREVIATSKVYRSARLTLAAARFIDAVTVRGFATPVDCIALTPLSHPPA